MHEKLSSRAAKWYVCQGLNIHDGMILKFCKIKVNMLEELSIHPAGGRGSNIWTMFWPRFRHLIW